MTPEDHQMLDDLAKKVAQTPPPQRDPEAEEFIRKNIGNRPDALYVMTQTVLIQNLAVEHAQQEIEQLKQRLAQQPAPQPQPQGQGSFLGRGSSYQQAPPPPAYGQPQASYAPPPQQASYAPPPPAGSYAAPPPAAGGMSSFLRSAGTTAAGVAAGALAFEGIRSMFGGVEHMFGGGQQHMGGGSGFFGGGGDREGETVVNNYYDRPEDSSSSLAEGLAPDDNVQYDDTNVQADDSASDDSSTDDSSYDDSSSDSDDQV